MQRAHAHLFDFAGTLASMNPSREVVLRDMITTKAGVDLSALSIATAYNHLDALLPYSSVEFITPQLRKDFYSHYNRSLLRLLGVAHLVEPDAVYTTFTNTETHWVLQTGVVEALKALKARGDHIAIVSNFDSRLEEIVGRLFPSGLLNDVHISQNIGCEKPDHAFYESYLKKAGLEACACSYIGDDYHLDFVPGRKLGMRAALLDRFRLFAHLPEAVPSLDIYFGTLLSQTDVPSRGREV